MPEDIVVDWSLRYPATARYTPKAIFSMDDTVMHCRVCVCVQECNVI